MGHTFNGVPLVQQLSYFCKLAGLSFAIYYTLNRAKQEASPVESHVSDHRRADDEPPAERAR